MSDTANQPDSAMGSVSFEQAAKQLEEIISKLESPATSLDDAIALYEKGEKLRKICDQKLATAKFKVEKLIIDGSNNPGQTEMMSKG